MSTPVPTNASIRPILMALAANAGIAVTKFGAALYTGSGSMLAESIHSVADCGNQLLLLLGMKIANRPADEEHPMGYGKELYFLSFIVAFLLFTVGGCFALYEGWQHLAHTEPISSPFVAMAVLAIGAALESLSLAGCLREVRKESGDMPLLAYFKESRSSELIVVLGEDVAALAGLAVAFAAVSLTWLNGNTAFDAIGSLIVGAMLLVVAFMLAVEIHALLIGQSADKRTRVAMKAFLKGRSEIAELYNLITLHHGDQIMIAVKARIAGSETITADQAAEMVNVVEAALHEKWPQIGWVFFEQDVRA